ncbi:terpene synthase family protein [Streptomyces albireticuli]|uniref:Uncharacterized protein n=1 Tax=Streptomyces albireticuli TaxID=1940 RepID=A0A2A2DAA5_9ACTN|nr:hypothetical protein [Streptomyces albireticuli]MCD9143515.1 hypothetical protein [Streptomyces albireticuli]MCD9164874.1 hypothetical protein [Streptomyces albireticuli]MCD9191632.1 hypothetical protein [Streptomyces albireticuli]PAU48455.1 hypothetical protein CK936_13220 [Streptomyces albireticuli]
MPSERPPSTDLRVNRHAAEAAEFIERWVRRTGLIQSFTAQRRFRRADCAAFAARVMPDAECERLKRGTAWLVWFFIFLDQSEERERALPSAEAPPEFLPFLPPDAGLAPPPRTALQRGLADAWRMVAPAMSPEWRLRFLARFREFLGSGAAAKPARPLFALVEYTSGYEVPAGVRALPAFRAMDDAAALFCPGPPSAVSPARQRSGQRESELLTARRETFRLALAALHRDMARRRLPAAAVSAASAYTEALTLWIGGPAPPGDRVRPLEGGRLSLTDDITGAPVDLLRARRPAPPPVPSTGGGAGTSHAGRE